MKKCDVSTSSRFPQPAHVQMTLSCFFNQPILHRQRLVLQCGPQDCLIPLYFASMGTCGSTCKWVPRTSEKEVISALSLTTLGFVQVTTNGIIAMSEPPTKESQPGLFPPTFGAVAPFLADLDTTDGLGKVYYREDLSPSVIQLAAECIQRGFPEVVFQPNSVVVVTWESVAAYQGPNKDPIQEGKVSTCSGSSSSELELALYSFFFWFDVFLCTLCLNY